MQTSAQAACPRPLGALVRLPHRIVHDVGWTRARGRHCAGTRGFRASPLRAHRSSHGF